MYILTSQGFRPRRCIHSLRYEYRDLDSESSRLCPARDSGHLVTAATFWLALSNNIHTDIYRKILLLSIM